ncbi:MAG: methyltransferase domain-containing protein [Bacteroidota bacterium]
MKDILGRAALDYYEGHQLDALWINNKYAEAEEMPLEVFFRTQEELTDLELLALHECNGTTLDIGAGAGAFSICLQDQRKEVFALDNSPLLVEVMEKLGVKTIVNYDLWQYKDAKFDTLLLIMNGLGIVGTMEKLTTALDHFRTLLKPGGQILLDSSDISYLYEDEEIARPENTYYGQLDYQYEYQGTKSDWFQWLYIDQDSLSKVADEKGWSFEKLFEDDMSQYLARLTLK